MSRQVTIPAISVTEDITNITHFPGDSVNFYVGRGTIKDGSFTFSVPQQYEPYDIRADLYLDLITRYTQSFAKEDLWYYVDIIRSGATSTAPSPNYDWNQQGQVWTPNMTRALNSKLDSVEAKRIELNNSPISHDNTLIDADVVARDNIIGKLAELQAAIDLNVAVSPMVWRDTSNNILSWTAALEYKDWLQGLVVAIAHRNTILYQTSWGHKANLRGFTDFTSIEAYDISTGWV